MYTSTFPSKLPSIGTTIFSRMSALAQQHGAINLAQGFPDFPLHPSLMDWVTEGMQKGYNQYSPMPGFLPLREAHAADIHRRTGTIVCPSEEITITCGATEACFTAITTIVQPGDEVILFEPAFDVYLPAIYLAGGIPKSIRLEAPDFDIPWEKVKAAINDSTKLIIVNTPHNPTGKVWQHSDMIALEKLVEDQELYVLSDEVYEHIVFDEHQHHSAIEYPGLREKSLVVGSFGKTYHVTGWRIGYCIAPPLLTKEFRKVHQYNTFAAASPFQYAIAKALSETSHMDGLRSFFEAKRNFFLDSIKSTRWMAKPTQGSYFQIVSYENISSLKDVEFSEYLTKEFKLASIPVSVFYQQENAPSLLRFCFAKSDDTLEKAVRLLCHISASL